MSFNNIFSNNLFFLDRQFFVFTLGGQVVGFMMYTLTVTAVGICLYKLLIAGDSFLGLIICSNKSILL